MKVFKNRSNLIFTLITIMILVIFNLIIFNLISLRDKEYNNEIYNSISNIITVIKEKYPSVKEEDIINIINSNDNSDDALSIYGIDKDSDIIMNTKNIRKSSNNRIIIILLIFDLVMIISLLTYLFNRKNKYDDVLNTVKKINKKIYDLDINDNSEDEISILKNELYKTTLMLKQQYELELSNRKNLQVNIEDVSHQLKTPLATISILLDNIIDSKKIDEKTTKNFLIDIRKQIYSMNDLIIALLKSSRLSSGVIVFKNDKINVNNLLNDIKDNLSLILDLKNLSLDIKCDKDININGDEIWETEALTNIIKNAIEYSNEDDVVNIKVIKNSVYTKIEVSDNGVGIDSYDIKRIFDRFYKNNEKSNSFGIGLNLAKTIIEKDGGFISVKSIKDKGTTFIIKYMNK